MNAPGDGHTAQAPASRPAPAAGGEIDWTGSWSVAVDYRWSCSVMGTTPSERSDSGRWTIRVGGRPNDLEAEVQVSPAGYYLSGGGGRGLRLCGGFPLNGHSGRANTLESNVCLIFDDVAGADEMRGRVEGEYRTLAARCRVVSGTAELSR